ncbi:MAG: MFS transporter [Nitrospirae bacterium]|nr:MFS transporter [Nitrospirota bacterium]
MSPYALLCTSGLVAIFSSTMAKSPVLPLYASYLGVGPLGIGIVASVSPVAGITCSVLAGVFADRYGNKRMLTVAAFVFFTAPLLYLLAANVMLLSLVRFYHGLATAIMVPVSMAVISGIYAERKGEALGMFSSATLAGRFFAPIVGGAILGYLATNPHAGFNAVYLVCSAAGLITLLLMSRLPKDNIRRVKTKRTDVLKMLSELTTHRGILLTGGVEAAVLFAYGTFETFLPLYLINKGMNAYEIGAVLSAQIISVALTKPVMGKLSDKYGRSSQIAAGILLCAVFMSLIIYAKGIIVSMIVSIAFGLSMSVVTSATSALIGDLSRKEQLSSSMGVFASIMDIGHTTGPLASGIIAACFGIGKVFLFSSALLLIVFSIFTASCRSAKMGFTVTKDAG